MSAVSANRRFEFQKRSQLFIRTHNETRSVAAVCVSNPDRSPVAIIAETQPQLQLALLRFSAALLIVVDHLRRSFARFKLRAHLLDLRSLFFELRLMRCLTTSGRSPPLSMASNSETVTNLNPLARRASKTCGIAAIVGG